jgi:dihydrodipicolinate synthase/N-acetylneuraminate lyase
LANLLDSRVARSLQAGAVIPACPLALTGARRWDERRQRALFRYYLAAGAGGLAVAVHTTQFAIRESRHGLFRPLLQLAAEEMERFVSQRGQPVIRISGICGATAQALDEAVVIRENGFNMALLNLGALKDATEGELLVHCQAVANVIPIMGFYLQPALGGRILPFSFWRQLAQIDNVVAIKIAPFNRYQSLDVVRAIAEASRSDVALYTGNDDHILLDLLTPFRFQSGDGMVTRRIVGGLLGQWAVWTRRAVELVQECHRLAHRGGDIPGALLSLDAEITDANAAIFDAAHDFVGAIPGVHEILRRQGLLEGIWCLDPNQTLSPGQAAEIERVCKAYPHLNDDVFVRDHLDDWLRD